MNQIMRLTGLAFGAAAVVFKVLDYASYLSLLCALTGVGIAAGAAILAYRWAIEKIAWEVGKYAAIQL